ncbi:MULTISPECIES: DNA-processing protein DprA [unclassified Bradyrhizobium]|uniref:DNA-processing protein DprA n=1 Tax=unclassified Bradyrhizobium TaxID=2631580 RepID=UPI003395A16D
MLAIWTSPTRLAFPSSARARVSENGWKRASKLARQLADLRVTIVSGLAKGVDTATLSSAIDNSGRVAAVIGTPLDKGYPAENAASNRRSTAAICCSHPLRKVSEYSDQTFPCATG